MLEGADYSAFSRFEYSEDEAPAYLEEEYGIENTGDAPGLNIGKVIHEDLQFVDSKGSLGVQAADLLAAGVRRLLRRNFNDHSQAARLLGTSDASATKGALLQSICWDSLVTNSSRAQGLLIWCV